MTVQRVSDPKTPIGEILQAAGSEGLLLTSEGEAHFAIMPLDDDLIDYLIERSPQFAAECQQIREHMRSGQFHTHDEVKRILEES